MRLNQVQTSRWRTSLRLLWSLVGAAAGLGSALAVARAASVPFPVGLPGRIHRLSVRADTGTCRTTTRTAGRSFRRGSHWYLVRAMLRRCVVGLCTRPSVNTGFHAAERHRASTGRRQRADHDPRPRQCQRPLDARGHQRGRARFSCDGLEPPGRALVRRANALSRAMDGPITAEPAVGHHGGKGVLIEWNSNNSPESASASEALATSGYHAPPSTRSSTSPNGAPFSNFSVATVQAPLSAIDWIYNNNLRLSPWRAELRPIA